MVETEKNEQFQQAECMALVLANEQQRANLFLLLQNGFFIKADVGCTIEEFFLNQLQLSPEFVETRIQGIFLNGKPADHIDTDVIRDGARLTLSGTMPGLAGASLRKGPLAFFRHSITHHESGDYNYKGKGFIQLKLLNLLMKYMGPGLLEGGIYLHSSELADYLANLPAEFWQECKSVSLGDKKVDPGLFQEGRWLPAEEMVKLFVILS